MTAPYVGQSHAFSLVFIIVSISFYVLRSLDFVGFLVMSLISLASTLLPSLQQDSPELDLMFLTVDFCIFFHQLLVEASLMTIGPGTSLGV